MILNQLAIEIEPDDCGYHAVVASVDAVLHVTNSYPTPEEAEHAARRWIERS